MVYNIKKHERGAFRLHFIFLIMALMLIISFSLNTDSITKSGNYTNKNKTIFTILTLAFIIRVVFAFFFVGFKADLQCFDLWSDIIYTDGFSSFYSSPHFTDYPPGYMYVLYILGFIKNTLSLSKEASYILLKLPAIICDVVTGYLIYKLLCKDYKKPGLIVSLYLFNPAIIINSAIWGQVDSVFVLPVFLMLYFMIKKNLIASYFLFAIAIIIKPQALFYAPILFSGIIEQVILTDFSAKRFFKHLFSGLLAILSIFLMALPFRIPDVIDQYINTLDSYNYLSVNAYNLWTAFNLNWVPANSICSLIGYFFIATATILCIYRFFKSKLNDKYFYLSSIICYSVFILSIKMHERYAFPTILFILSAFLISKEKFALRLYGILSALLFFNTAHVLFYFKEATYTTIGYRIYSIIFGILSVLTLVIWWWYTLKKKDIISSRTKNRFISKEITE